MSNYNSIIQQNNTELQEILDSVNALPDAGPSVETCTLTVIGDTGDIGGEDAYYMDEQLNIQTGTYYAFGTASISGILKNSIVCLAASFIITIVSGDVRLLADTDFGTNTFVVSSDATIRLTYPE